MSDKNIKNINAAEDILLYPKTFHDTTIYVDTQREAHINHKPSKQILAAFVVKEEREKEELSHELLEEAKKAIIEITKEDIKKVISKEISFEIYKGDMEILLGEAEASFVQINSALTSFSGVKFKRRVAWAQAFEWQKRLTAKYIHFKKYTFVDGEDHRRETADTYIYIRLPIVSAEFLKLFNDAFNHVIEAKDDLKEQIRLLEEQIKIKQAELQELQDQLTSLKLKAQLDEMKETLTEPEGEDE
ncbi:MAG: hypothetical protein QXT31_03480 [Candidatus Bathyarchaeia archaeon]